MYTRRRFYIRYCLFRIETWFFSIVFIFISRYMFLKGVDNRFLLSKDESLTSDIDKVMAVNVF